MIYKVFRADEWTEAREAGRFEGSTDDRRDGFIHFSPADQVRETVARHFADEDGSVEDGLVIVGVDADRLGGDLKWESSRGGIEFPHLYGVWDFDQAPPVVGGPPGG